MFDFTVLMLFLCVLQMPRPSRRSQAAKKKMAEHCGKTALTSLDLTDSEVMAEHCGKTALTSLDLTDSEVMAERCGKTALTSFDLTD